jgi:hypothetical protein
MNRQRSIRSIGNDSGVVNERLLSAREAAESLGMSESWLHGSTVPHVKLGRRKLYRPSDLRRYVEARVSTHLAPEGT